MHKAELMLHFYSTINYVQGVSKRALQFLSIPAQSRCDPDPDHFLIGPGLTETVTLFWDTLYMAPNGCILKVGVERVGVPLVESSNCYHLIYS